MFSHKVIYGPNSTKMRDTDTYKQQICKHSNIYIKRQHDRRGMIVVSVRWILLTAKAIKWNWMKDKTWSYQYVLMLNNECFNVF